MNHCSLHGYYNGPNCPGCHFSDFPTMTNDSVSYGDVQLARIANALEKLVALEESKTVTIHQHFEMEPKSE